MRKLGLALLLPALAILGAAFAQHLLTLGWPQIQKVPSAVMSIDSYSANVLTAVLCFLQVFGSVAISAYGLAPR